QSKPSSAFAPIAVTPDELGDLWKGYTLATEMRVDLNGKPFGRARIDQEMTFNMAQLVAHAARTRPLAAGSLIGSGTVSNKGADGGPGKPISDGGVGYSCLAEIRTIETIEKGAPTTSFLSWGDRVQIEVLDNTGHSIFGQIDQVVEQL
ncbi:MAG: fumarylacetoacetate hydrolase family protein, partial [Litorivicinus sp.]